MEAITLEHAMRLIEASHGQIFTAHVVKRTTGTMRVMNCRTEVDKYLRGGAAAYDPAHHNAIVVCDMALVRQGENPYRTIALEGLKQLSIGGHTYTVGVGK